MILSRQFTMTMICMLLSMCRVVCAQVTQDTNSAGNDAELLRVDLGQPLDFWLNRLESKSSTERQHAANVVNSAAGYVMEMHAEHLAERLPKPVGVVPIASSSETLASTDREVRSNIERFATEFTDSESRMIRLLRPLMEQQEVFHADNEASALAFALAVSSPDGRGIINARKTLPRGVRNDELLFQLVYTSPHIMPPDVSLKSILLPALKSLSDETRFELERQWQEAGEGVDDRTQPRDLRSLSLGLLSPVFGGALASRNQIQQELPLLIEALEPEYPQVIRCFSMACLCDLRSESEPALPRLRQLLNDESRTIRGLAARVIIYVRTDQRLVDEFGELLNWSPEDRKELADDIELERSAFEHCVGAGDSAGESEMRRYVTECLRHGSHHERRYVLRAIREFGPKAGDLEALVRECLDDEEPLTRDFAKQALTAIEAGKK
jgi:hypothetical protein